MRSRIETLYVCHSPGTDGTPDVFLNADVTPRSSAGLSLQAVAGAPSPARSSLHHPLRVRPARTVKKMPHTQPHVEPALPGSGGTPAARRRHLSQVQERGVTVVRTSGMLQQRHADKIGAVMVTGNDEALAVGGRGSCRSCVKWSA